MSSLNMSYEEVSNMNKIKAMLLLDGLKAVESEKYIMELKIASNQLLLNSKKHSNKFDDLRKELVKIYHKFGVKNIIIQPSFFSLSSLKGSFTKKPTNKKPNVLKNKKQRAKNNKNKRNRILKSEVK